MDALPFLLLAVLTFWMIQIGAYILYRQTTRKAITGTNKVKQKQYIVERIRRK